MENFTKEYEVEITSAGRSGDVICKTRDGALTFWWEFSMSGVIVSIPSDEKWNVYCESVNALWAQNRKPEIARRIGDEICRQKASAAKVEIEDEWINLLF